MKFVIIWLLFIILSVYCILDYYATTALIKVGFTEVNPLLLWIIGSDKNFVNILYFKILMIIIVGFLLWNYHKNDIKIRKLIKQNQLTKKEINHDFIKRNVN